MNLFWKVNRPLTSLDILEISPNDKWSLNYVNKLLGLLQKKGFLAISGVIQDGNHYIRQFETLLSKETYISDMLQDKGVGSASFAKIAVALVKKESKDDEDHQKLIEELEKMIQQFEETNGLQEK